MKISQKWTCIFLLFIIFFATQPIYADTALPIPVGKVVWIKGTLKAIMPNNEIRILQKDSILYLHDTLITDAATQAQIIFTDNTLMTFRENTRFYIDQYNYQPQNKKGSVGKYIMNLIEGGFRTITGFIAKNNPSDYQVNTPVSTIGVRGTDYTVYVHDGQLYLGYYSGTPCINRFCLSAALPYAYVPSPHATPVPLKEQPAVFKEKLDVVPVKMAPFAGNGQASSGTGTGASQTGTNGASNVTPALPNKPITSFCITQ